MIGIVRICSRKAFTLGRVAELELIGRRRTILRLTKMIAVTAAFGLTALAPTGAWAAEAAAGKAVYAAKCRACHGADGEGNPNMAKALKVEIKPLSQSNADITKAITDGRGKMKPISSVTGADLDNVVAYVQSLKK
jgi:mono/diheme cytochrome c family protein